MVRSSDCQNAAAGTDPPWPPLLKGGKGTCGAFAGAWCFERITGGCGPHPPGPPFKGGERDLRGFLCGLFSRGARKSGISIEFVVMTVAT